MNIRKAKKDDVPQIVALLANDELGRLREDYRTPIPPQYLDAYSNIESDANQELVVVEGDSNVIIGTLQLSFIQYLTYQGGIRAQIEAVRIAENEQGKGFGEQLIQWAVERAKTKGAHVLQLTTDKKRSNASQFYAKLGFNATHEGMKMHFNYE